MKYQIGAIIQAMIRYNGSDAARIQHALKVFAFAKSIGELQGLDEIQMETLEVAAVLHDIGIHNSEKKYGSSVGKYQELEGPPVAKELLLQTDIPTDIVERVCFLVGHHHTYTEIDGIDYQILVEADFLVNLYEDGLGRASAQTVLDKYFKTDAGKEYLTAMFLPSGETGAD